MYMCIMLFIYMLLTLYLCADVCAAIVVNMGFEPPLDIANNVNNILFKW